MNTSPPERRRLAKRSILIPAAVILLTVTTITVIANPGSDTPTARKASDIPLALATNLADVRDTIKRLNTSLDQLPTKSKPLYDSYLSDMDQLTKDCSNIRQMQQLSQQSDVGQQMKDMVGQSSTLCTDLGSLAVYSSRQYRAVAPLFDTADTLRVYERIAPLSSFKEHQIIRAFDKSTDAFGKLMPDTAYDFSSGEAIATALRANKPTGRDSTDVTTSKLRTARQQIIAQRANYWRTQIGIIPLQNTVQKQLDDNCAYLTQSNIWPSFCPRSE